MFLFSMFQYPRDMMWLKGKHTRQTQKGGLKMGLKLLNPVENISSMSIKS